MNCLSADVDRTIRRKKDEYKLRISYMIFLIRNPTTFVFCPAALLKWLEKDPIRKRFDWNNWMHRSSGISVGALRRERSTGWGRRKERNVEKKGRTLVERGSEKRGGRLEAVVIRYAPLKDVRDPAPLALGTLRGDGIAQGKPHLTRFVRNASSANINMSNPSHLFIWAGLVPDDISYSRVKKLQERQRQSWNTK